MNLYDFLKFLYNKTVSDDIIWDTVEDTSSEDTTYEISFLTSFNDTNYDVRMSSKDNSIWIEENSGCNIRNIKLTTDELISLKNSIISWIIEETVDTDEQVFENICQSLSE